MASSKKSNDYVWPLLPAPTILEKKLDKKDKEDKKNQKDKEDKKNSKEEDDQKDKDANKDMHKNDKKDKKAKAAKRKRQREEKERQWASTLSLEGEQKVSLVLGSRINICLFIRQKKHDSQLTGSYIIGWIGFYWFAKWLIKARLWMPDMSEYGFLFQFHC